MFFLMVVLPAVFVGLLILAHLAVAEAIRDLRRRVNELEKTARRSRPVINNMTARSTERGLARDAQSQLRATKGMA